MLKKIIAISLPVWLLCLGSAFSQIIIKGQTCVIAGSNYQYYIDYAGTWASNGRMKVCVEGGIIADQEERKRKNCTPNDAPLAAIIVIWNNVSKGSITISSSGGSQSFSVNIAPPLDPGTVGVKEQEFTDAAKAPSTIQCSPVSGGSCNPVYLYQWQQSDDAMIWSDIRGATSQHLSFSSPQKQTTYYRRLVTEKSSNTTAYSDIATVLVSPVIDTSAVTTNSGFTDRSTRFSVDNTQMSDSAFAFGRVVATMDRKNRINTK